MKRKANEGKVMLVRCPFGEALAVSRKPAKACCPAKAPTTPAARQQHISTHGLCSLGLDYLQSTLPRWLGTSAIEPLVK